MRIIVLSIFAALLFHGTAISAPTPDSLKPYVAEYEFSRGGKPAGIANFQLESADNGIWQLKSHTRGTQGLAALAGVEITETSRFSIDGNGLRCHDYHYRQTGLRKRVRSLECGDGKNGIISKDQNGEHRFASQPHVLDRQTVSLALAMDLATGKTGQLSYTVVDRERIETQNYTVIGKETVVVPAGRLETVKVERTHRDGERKTTTWFSADKGWIPVRVEQSNPRGEGYELRLMSLKR